MHRDCRLAPNNCSNTFKSSDLSPFGSLILFLANLFLQALRSIGQLDEIEALLQRIRCLGSIPMMSPGQADAMESMLPLAPSVSHGGALHVFRETSGANDCSHYLEGAGNARRPSLE